MSLPIAYLTRRDDRLIALPPLLVCDACGEDADMCVEYGCPHSNLDAIPEEDNQ